MDMIGKHAKIKNWGAATNDGQFDDVTIITQNGTMCTVKFDDPGWHQHISGLIGGCYLHVDASQLEIQED